MPRAPELPPSARTPSKKTAAAAWWQLGVGDAQTFRSFVAFAGGEPALWDDVSVGWDGARAAAELLRLLTAERGKPAPEPVPAPIPDEYLRAKAVVDALKAAGL